MVAHKYTVQQRAVADVMSSLLEEIGNLRLLRRQFLRRRIRLGSLFLAMIEASVASWAKLLHSSLPLVKLYLLRV